jgi:hypothetical protein
MTGAIKYLSHPSAVHMADTWFDISCLSHFWIRRRYEVLCSAMRRVPVPKGHVAEIGCGNGLLQAQLENLSRISVDGFDLNEEALKRNNVKRGNLYCYDIHQRDVCFKERYSAIFLFDVLEHIEEEDKFIDSVLFHLSKDGLLYLNVPAFNSLFSAYDVAVGHQRRYDRMMLQRVASKNGLEVLHWTYWGLPLVPLLVIRKLLLASKENENLVSTGFHYRNRLLNSLLLGLSQCEWLPQHFRGTSLMAVLKRKPSGECRD